MLARRLSAGRERAMFECAFGVSAGRRDATKAHRPDSACGVSAANVLEHQC
jgi:hypothetical protein